VSDLEEELRHVAGQAADHAQPLAAAEVIRRGDRRRRRRVVRDGVAVLMAAGAIAAGAGVLSGSLDGAHPAPQSPAGRPAPSARPAPSSVTRSAAPVPSPPVPSPPLPSPRGPSRPVLSGRTPPSTRFAATRESASTPGSVPSRTPPPASAGR
jgi:hypothetical protein